MKRRNNFNVVMHKERPRLQCSNRKVLQELEKRFRRL